MARKEKSRSEHGREFHRYLHSNMRLRSRYGFELDFDQYLEACNAFKQGHANGIRVQNATGDMEGWVKIGDQWACAHFKVREGLIATFLPKPLTPEPCPKCSLETE